MATLRREVALPVTPAAAWAAVADIGQVHSRLARGFVADTQLEEEGAVRRVTFANGLVARERIVTADHGRRRLAYASEGGRLRHHSASFEVTEGGAAGDCRLVWITDLLPDSMAPAVEAMVDAGVAAIRATLTE